MKCVAILVLACGTAFANPADDAYNEGRRLYDLREFADAIVKFKEAYRLATDARSLFNIAQSYRLLGDCPNAHAYYKTFQRNYPKERPDVVTKFIAELEPCKDPKPVEPVAPPTVEPVAQPRTIAPVIAPQPRDGEVGGGGKKKFGIAIGIAGVALVGTGTYFGFSARSKSNTVNGAPVWDPDLHDTAKRHGTLSRIFWGTGGVAVIGGVVLYYLGHRESMYGPRITTTSTTVGVAWSFE